MNFKADLTYWATNVSHYAARTASLAALGVPPRVALKWVADDAKEALKASRRIQDEDAKP